MISAILSNSNNKDSESVRISFPITDYKENYDSLQSIGIGSVTERDCFVSEINFNSCPILKRLEKININVDELDYLVKRLDSFDGHEIAKFQGVAASRGYDDITNFINLTFCCQETTIVRDFTDLEAVGREHYMDIRGGLSEKELNSIDFRKEALSLILNENGYVTPYGVVYENAMCLDRVYDGKRFPAYDYDAQSILTVTIKDRSIPEDNNPDTWLYLPLEECQIERVILRAGIATFDDVQLSVFDSNLHPEVEDLILKSDLNLLELNSFCLDFKNMGEADQKKFKAALQWTEPLNAWQLKNLMKQLDLFEFVPDVFTPEDYGCHMIRESGHYNYDEELDEFYDFEKYGKWRMSNENGQFTQVGYISCHGLISLEEIMAGGQTERMEMTMGGMQLG